MGYGYIFIVLRTPGFLSGSAIKNLPPIQELQDIQIPSLGGEDALEESNPVQYSFLENPWTEESGGLQSMGLHRVRHDWSNLVHSYTHTVIVFKNDYFLKYTVLWFNQLSRPVKLFPVLLEANKQILGTDIHHTVLLRFRKPSRTYGPVENTP